MKKIDRSGKQYKYLTVLRESAIQRLPGKVLWDCRCICGKLLEVSSSNLSRGQASCGCQRGKTTSIRQKDRVFAIQKYVFQRNVQGTARARNISVEINEHDFARLCVKSCYYCGSEPYKKAEDKQHGSNKALRSDKFILYNGLDRLDSSRGYTIDNVVPCCPRCNYAKNTMTVDEFVEWVGSVYEHMKFSQRAAVHA